VADYYINSEGGGNNSPYDTWAKGALLLETVLALAVGTSDKVAWIASDHSEAPTANKTYTLPDGMELISVNRSTDAYEVGASITSNGSYDMILTALLDKKASIHGVKFSAGDDLTLSYNARSMITCYDCESLITGHSDADSIYISGANAAVKIVGGKLNVTETSQQISIAEGVKIIFDDVEFGANLQKIMQLYNTSRVGSFTFKNSTFLASQINAGTTAGVAILEMIRCKIPSTYNFDNVTARALGSYDLYSCDTGSGYHHFDYGRLEGKVLESEAVWRTDGDIYDKDISTTHFSAEYQPNSNVVLFTNPLSPRPIKTLKLDLSGGDVVLTIELLQQNASVAPLKLTHGNVQLRVVYPDITNTALGVTVSSGEQETTPITVLNAGSADNLDDSTETWGGTGLLTDVTKQKISVTVPQNTQTGMDKAVVELWLDVSVDLDAVSAELFVDTLPAVS